MGYMVVSLSEPEPRTWFTKVYVGAIYLAEPSYVPHPSIILGGNLSLFSSRAPILSFHQQGSSHTSLMPPSAVA